MTLTGFARKYHAAAIEDDCTVNSEQMKKFSRDFKSSLRDFCKKNNAEITGYSLGHYSVSGFIRYSDGHTVYLSYDVPRYGTRINADTASCSEGVLYRKAKNNKDYTGEQNHFTSLRKLESALENF